MWKCEDNLVGILALFGLLDSFLTNMATPKNKTRRCHARLKS